MAPRSELRWGIVGVARICRALVPALQASSRNRLVAVASRDAARAEGAAREWGAARAHASYDALLADPDVDAVYIPLPNSLHVEWTLRACRAGKHVLCEKPLVQQPEDAARLAEAAAKAGVVVSEAFMYRHHALTLRVLQLVESGALGAVLLVKGAFSFTLTRPGDVRLDPGLGGGCLWDVGCYPVSYARTVLREEPADALGWQTLGPTGVDVAFAGQLRFPSGAIAQFDSGFAAPFRTEIEIVGTDGVLRVPRPFKPGKAERLTLVRGDKSETIDVTGDELYLGEVEDLASAALSGATPRLSLEWSRRNCAALVALLESARSGRMTAVSS